MRSCPEGGLFANFNRPPSIQREAPGNVRSAAPSTEACWEFVGMRRMPVSRRSVKRPEPKRRSQFYEGCEVRARHAT
jgi:hypothetical protein